MTNTLRYCLPLLFLLTLSTRARAQDAGPVLGEWYAILDAMGTKLPVGLQLAIGENGQLGGTMTSPSQTKAKIPLNDVSWNGSNFRFAVNALGARYDAALNAGELRGVFNQAQVDFPLVFTRHRPQGFPIGDGPITVRARAQDPTDFPYERRGVTFPGAADGVALSGELTLPSKGKPKAVAILLAGSGPSDRNHYLGADINHSPFLVLSDYLTRRGYAVLRYDDRGVGESTGDFRSATSADMAEDAFAAVRFLREEKDLRKVPVGLIGLSEGGLIAPVVAAADGELDFVVLMAAPGVSGDSLMLQQYKKINETMGMPAPLIDRNLRSYRAAYTWIREHPELDSTAYEEGLYGVFEEQLVNLPAPLRRSIRDPRAFNQQFVGPLMSPWMRYFIGFDPQEYLSRLTAPTLIMNGLLDTQVPAMENMNAISQALARAENDDIELVPLPGLNHLFQPATTGAPTEYGQIETTMDPGALETIGAWLDARFE